MVRLARQLAALAVVLPLAGLLIVAAFVCGCTGTVHGLIEWTGTVDGDPQQDPPATQTLVGNGHGNGPAPEAENPE